MILLDRLEVLLFLRQDRIFSNAQLRGAKFQHISSKDQYLQYTHRKPRHIRLR